MLPWLHSSLKSPHMDKQQADHLSFGGQGLFGENTNADQVINTKHKAMRHMTLTDESWKEVWSLLDWGIHPFTGTGMYSPDKVSCSASCCYPRMDHWQMSTFGSNSTSPHGYNLFCLSSYTSRQLFSCLAWFVLLHVIFFELLLSYYWKEESSGRTNLKSPPRRLWRQAPHWAKCMA